VARRRKVVEKVKITCTNCSDTGEIKKPVSDYIRQLDVQMGYAGRAKFTTVFCTCKAGKAQARKHADEQFN
jgi:hypothetical protein